MTDCVMSGARPAAKSAAYPVNRAPAHLPNVDGPFPRTDSRRGPPHATTTTKTAPTRAKRIDNLIRTLTQ